MEIQAEAAFNFIKVLLDSGYPFFEISRLLVDFKSNYPGSRYAENAKQMLASIYCNK